MANHIHIHVGSKTKDAGSLSVANAAIRALDNSVGALRPLRSDEPDEIEGALDDLREIDRRLKVAIAECKKFV